MAVKLYILGYGADFSVADDKKMQSPRSKDVYSPSKSLMKIKTYFLFALVATGLAHLQAAPPKAPKLVVAIVVDQLRYDYLDRFHHQFGEGGLKLLTDEGAFMTFAQYDYSPTITAPGHASFFSGSSPMMHGIIGNEWFDKRTGQPMYCVSDDAVNGVGTDPQGKAGKMSPRNFIGSTVADQMRLHWDSKVVAISIKDRGAILPGGKKPAGAFWFESATGNFITSSYYMQELPAWVKAFNDSKRPDAFIGQTWERLLDEKEYLNPDDAAGESSLAGETTRTFPHQVIKEEKDGYEPILSTPFGNQLLAEFAKAAIEGENLGQGSKPDLLCVSFSSNDYCGHRFGPYSQEVQDITLRMDRQFQEFFAYLDKKIGLTNVTIVLTADHGVCPTPENAQEQGLDAGRPPLSDMMNELQEKLAERFGPGRYFLGAKIGFKPRLSDGNLYFNYPVLIEKQLSPETVTSFAREWALSTGVFHAVYGREQLLDGRAPGVIGQRVMKGFNGERSGDIVFIPKPFLISGSGKPGAGTTHGSPFSYDTHIPVLFYGASFKAGRYADEFYITDIAPTLSAALGIQEPPACMGKPMVKILK
ncbi:type I phosphodiesterase/nucleotide pyrophosphatase [Prosthecobacter fusiformis]|uniref:Type I phosphodiesterase/nucleotide pyrophosphatase n=1 Tax=Prosthecobacter fusiformis TaxID=48464 RepID=A0A4R7SSU3_9BACT|nr:alkaline phosphatase family protein [Prosthecobacter fusiformis]TDU81297.1 type I phosphodiesterase/nucleotide pyrophosphatase [Prosthecobacter fusiformis]